MWNKITNLLRTNVALSLLGNGVSTFLSLLTFTLQARWLTPSDLGAYVYLYTIYTLFDTVRTGLLFNALLQQGAASTTEEGYRRWEGAVWQMNLLFSFAGMALGGLGVLLFGSWMVMDGVSLGWLAAISLVSIPGNIASWMLLARSRFAPMQVQKLLFPAGMLILLVAVHYSVGLTQERILLANLGVTTLIGLCSVLVGWCLPATVREGTARERKHLFDYGKFSIGALVGSNLLRNSDVYLLRFFIGNEAVGLYAIPQRLIQIIEVPLRSVVSASIPAIVRTFHHQPRSVLSKLVAEEAGLLTFILVPAAIVGIFMADYLVIWVAGSQYREAGALVQIFLIYSMLMPLDRYLGVTLDAIGKPRANLIKMLGMLLINVAGDCLALWWFKTAEAVAVVSILTFASGILIGLHHIRLNGIPLGFRQMATEGWTVLTYLYQNRLTFWKDSAPVAEKPVLQPEPEEREG